VFKSKRRKKTAVKRYLSETARIEREALFGV